MHTLCKKCTCTRDATVQKLLCHGNYCELILSLARASFSLSFAALLLSGQNQSLDAVRSRNPSTSTLAHDVVAAAVLHKHYSIIHVGAGLIQFFFVLNQNVAVGVTSSRILFSPFFHWPFQ